MAKKPDQAADRLKLLDASRFPLVRYRIPEPDENAFADGDSLLADMEVLLRRDQPFIVISFGLHDREPAEVRKGRALWFKQNRERFAERCRAMIHVEPDDETRRAMAERLSQIGKEIGTQLTVARDPAAADALARKLLGREQEERSVQGEDQELAESVAALLETFQAKLLARDFDALEALMTEDFTYVEIDGSALDREALLTRERRGATSQPATEIQHKLISVEGDRREAEGLVDVRFQTVVGSGPSEVTFRGQGRQRIRLRHDGTSWKFQKVVIEHQELTRDGEAAGAEAIEEMHRGK